MSLRLKAKDGDSPARRQRCYLCKKQINSTFIKEFNRMWHQECLQRFKHRSPRDGDGNTIASPAQTGSLRRNKKRAANEGSDDEGSAEEGSPGKVEHVLPKPLSEQLKDQKGVLKTRKSEAADQQAIVVRRRSSTRTRTLGLPDATRVNKSRLQMSEQKSRQNDQKSRQSDQKSRQNGSEALVTESLHILRNEFARFETKLKHELESVQSSGYRKGQNELKGQISNLQQKITRLKSQRQVMDDKIEDLSRVNKKLDTERKHLWYKREKTRFLRQQGKKKKPNSSSFWFIFFRVFWVHACNTCYFFCGIFLYSLLYY